MTLRFAGYVEGGQKLRIEGENNPETEWIESDITFEEMIDRS